MLSLNLEGLIPAVVTPLTEDDEIDERSLRSYARWVLGHEGLGGVAINMDTGEAPHLRPGERERILRIWQEENDGRVPLLAGLNAQYTAQAIEEAQRAEDAGADGVVAFPIPAFTGKPLDPEVPYRYHKAIADAVSLPMVLFQLQPALAGVIFDPETLRRLVNIENVVAIKEASFDAVTYTKTVALLEEMDKQISILTGNDNFIYESLVMGAQGALIGFGTLAIRQQIEMIRAARERDYERAEAIWKRIKPLEEVIFADPVRDYRARTKTALHLMGLVESDYMRPPLLRIGDEKKQHIETALRRAEAWVEAAPAGGGRPGTWRDGKSHSTTET
jgi:4-hydroxy-tetrahydrodipicolinate synthase